MRLSKKQRAQLQAVLDLVEASPDINLGQAIRVLEARSMIDEAADNRAEMLLDENLDPDPEVAAEERAEFDSWSPADELEAQLDGNLDESRDFVIFEFEAMQEMGAAFFGRKWTRAAK